ncbi:GNAT family N-acetyltransferase [Neobacillus sp. D3-1R]|uniref:GNAT family N-acetyltransferase n=1 Tax=Neobacillus sp. D3-1R TaxID=3445778 RepID=UPI003FA148E5
MGINIRQVNDSDRKFIISLAERFNEFAFMGWRDPQAMNEAQVRMAKESFGQKDSDSDMFIAENENQVRLGFLHMSKNEDYFTGEKQGYISSIVVSKEGEGKGIAKKLMKTAEEWSIQKGYKQIVLHVFANNERAIRFYEHLNYETEIVKMVKEINSEDKSSREVE